MNNQNQTDLQKNLTVNKYVIFKLNDCFYEGRICEIIFDTAGKPVYRIFSFFTFEYLSLNDPTHIIITTHESKKKIRPSSVWNRCKMVRIPGLLKNLLRIDRDYFVVNQFAVQPKITISKLIQDFIEFFRSNSLLYDDSIMEELSKGFKHLFNKSLPFYLLYKNEEVPPKSNDYTTLYGPMHFLRLLYFIQVNSTTFVTDSETQTIVNDCCLYFIDFLDTKYNEYFL